jgi:hypothetical protein
MGDCKARGAGEVYDICGVCGGNDVGCVDCQGKVNGSSVIDPCGICDGDGGSCGFELFSLLPSVIPNNGVVSFGKIY